MQLDFALQKFVEAFKLSALSSGGLSMTEARSIQPPLGLGEALTEYFSRLDFQQQPQVGGAMLMMLFDMDELPGAQSGWRFIRKPDGSVAQDRSWPESLVVIADRNGDAIAVDSASPQGVVYGCIQRRTVRIAGSLAQFLTCVAELLDIEREVFSYECKTEDFEFRPDFLALARAVAARRLGEVDGPAFLGFYFG